MTGFAARGKQSLRLRLLLVSSAAALAFSAPAWTQVQTAPVPPNMQHTMRPLPGQPMRGSMPQAPVSQSAPSAASAPGQTPSLLQQPPTQAVINTLPDSLTIHADNASLTQTLQQIAEKTGMHLEGLSADQRVFGDFGPGKPRDVLNTFLTGTGYNILMIGALDNGAPKQLILSQKKAATPAQPVPPPSNANEDDAAEAPPEDQPPPQQIPGRGGEPTNGPPSGRNMREMLQLRQQQQQAEQSAESQPSQPAQPPQ